MPLTITADEFMSLLRDIVAERGEDFVYYARSQKGVGEPACSYVTSANEPPVRCVIGEVAFRMGVDTCTLASWDPMGDVCELICQEQIDPVGGAGYLMKMAQRKQDQGDPYGEMLRQVEDAYAAYLNRFSS